MFLDCKGNYGNTGFCPLAHPRRIYRAGSGAGWPVGCSRLSMGHLSVKIDARQADGSTYRLDSRAERFRIDE